MCSSTPMPAYFLGARSTDGTIWPISPAAPRPAMNFPVEKDSAPNALGELDEDGFAGFGRRSSIDFRSKR